LRFVEDLSNQQIADILGLTNDVVRQRISRGLRKLKEILSNLL
jgi:DNA-directed RNA polymerase specialized sigma24 family protein